MPVGMQSIRELKLWRATLVLSEALAAVSAVLSIVFIGMGIATVVPVPQIADHPLVNHAMPAIMVIVPALTLFTARAWVEERVQAHDNVFGPYLSSLRPNRPKRLLIILSACMLTLFYVLLLSAKARSLV